jgi:serine phosphatase RsbU (regulator of sigma subunit)
MTSNDIRETVSILVENNDKVWVCADNSVGYLNKRDSMKYVRRPFTGIEAGKINTIYPEKNGICWIGTTDGLYRYDENTIKDYGKNYKTLIRKVSLPDKDSAIFLGTQPGAGLIPSLPWRDNSIRLEFSALFYEYSGKILYSYKLEERSSKWSQWTKENYQEFTNLREGNYTFSVKARNIYGTESEQANYSFAILPPWYRTIPAYILYVIIAVALFWIFARLYSYKLKRENIRLEGIVSERTAEIMEKNLVLEHQKKEIEDSIRYARRIQSAVIPSDKTYHELLPESFVLFKPLNIVSGDFYWIGHVGSKIIFTAADCTGHGVPGAFMSMLGVAFLNEIVNKDHITVPDQILNSLRDKVIQALQQQGVSGETRDGMDIALICIDKEAGKLEFAGAYNPLIMIRNGEIIETAGDKMPIGFYENMHSFRKQEIAIEKGDLFYMFSDGYEDQFGGPEGKKFKSRRLKSLLLEICGYTPEKQKEALEMKFEEWKGDMPQVDDIVVVGISIR